MELELEQGWSTDGVGDRNGDGDKGEAEDGARNGDGLEIGMEMGMELGIEIDVN